MATDEPSVDVDALERVARDRGLTCATAAATVHHGRPVKWRASVSVPARSARHRGGYGYMTVSWGAGRTEAEALSKALARALAREAGVESLADQPLNLLQDRIRDLESQLREGGEGNG